MNTWLLNNIYYLTVYCFYSIEKSSMDILPTLFFCVSRMKGSLGLVWNITSVSNTVPPLIAWLLPQTPQVSFSLKLHRCPLFSSLIKKGPALKNLLRKPPKRLPEYLNDGSGTFLAGAVQGIAVRGKRSIKPWLKRFGFGFCACEISSQI